MKSQDQLLIEFAARAKAAGIGITPLMKRAGMSYQTWWNITNKKRRAQHDTILAIENALQEVEKERRPSKKR